MYEGGIRVPACFVWEEKIKAGEKTDNLALTMDIYPTLLEIANVDLQNEIDGISLLKFPTFPIPHYISI